MELCFLSNLSSQDWAAWVQAIGSIGAVLAAFIVSNRQFKHALLLETEKRARSDARLVDSVMAIAEEGKTVAEQGHRIVAWNECPIDWEDYNRAKLAAAYNALYAIPIHTLPSSELVRDVVGFRLSLRDLDDQLHRWMSVCNTSDGNETRECGLAADQALVAICQFYDRLGEDRATWQKALGAS